MRWSRLLLFTSALASSTANAWPVPSLPNLDVRLTGFVQPEFEAINSDPLSGKDQIGFALFRARVLALGKYSLDSITFGLRLEVEGTPQFSLFDAYADARVQLAGRGLLRVIVGQHKAPVSRQILVWDPDLQVIGKSWVTELAPGHQLGLSASLHLPHAPWVQLWAGVYNGKGKNVIENVDKHFMYVGRLAIRPIGPLEPYVESALGENQLSFAVNTSYNVTDQGDADQAQLVIGGDAFFCWRGLSIYGDVLFARTRYTSHDVTRPSASRDFNSLGYEAQAGYLLPLPGYLYRRFEVKGRFQGILRNDTVPLAQLGDPNQTHYDAGGGINYYQFGHSLKLMLDYHHYIIPEDVNRLPGKSASNDAVFVLLNYRLE